MNPPNFDPLLLFAVALAASSLYFLLPGEAPPSRERRWSGILLGVAALGILLPNYGWITSASDTKSVIGPLIALSLIGLVGIAASTLGIVTRHIDRQIHGFLAVAITNAALCFVIEAFAIGTFVLLVGLAVSAVVRSVCRADSSAQALHMTLPAREPFLVVVGAGLLLFVLIHAGSRTLSVESAPQTLGPPHSALPTSAGITAVREHPDGHIDADATWSVQIPTLAIAGAIIFVSAVGSLALFQRQQIDPESPFHGATEQ